MGAADWPVRTAAVPVVGRMGVTPVATLDGDWRRIAEFGTDREHIRLALEAEKIESRPVWKPMRRQPVFHACASVGGGVVAEFFARGLCLPSGSNLGEADLERVTEVVRSLRSQGNSPAAVDRLGYRRRRESCNFRLKLNKR